MMEERGLSKEEKQMTHVRLPARFSVLSGLDLFISLLVCIFLCFNHNWIPLGILVAISILPALVFIVSYSNYVVLFDKKRIVFRDYFRRVHRYAFTDIIDAEEKGNYFILYTENKKISFTRDSVNGRTLMDLVLKKKDWDQKKAGSKKKAELPIDAILNIVVGIGAAAFFYAIYYFFFLDQSNQSRTVTHSFYFIILLCLACSVLGIAQLLLLKKGSEEEDNAFDRRGHYLINRDGAVFYGSDDKRFIISVVFFFLGFLLNGLTYLFYAISAVFFLWGLIRGLRIFFLYRCPESYVRKVLSDYRPSPRLEELLPEHYRKYIDTNICPQFGTQDFFEEEEKTKWESVFLYWGKRVMLAALIPCFIALCIFCNYYLNDARFDHTFIYETTFYPTGEHSAAEETVILIGAVNDEEEKSYRVEIPVAAMGRENWLEMQEKVNAGEVFYIKKTGLDDTLKVLEIRDAEGTVYFSEDDSRELLKERMVPRMIWAVAATIIVFLIGATLTLYGRSKESSIQSDIEELQKLTEEERQMQAYGYLWEYEGAKIYRGNFYTSAWKNFIGGLFICGMFLVCFLGIIIASQFDGNTAEFYNESCSVAEVQITEACSGEEGIVNHYFFGDDWDYLVTENGEIFFVERFMESMDDPAAFEKAIEEKQTFSLLVNGEDAYTVTDENGYCYYSLKDVEAAEKWETITCARSIFILFFIAALYLLSVFLTLRYPEKMPGIFVSYVIKRTPPTEHLADALPEKKKTLKAEVLREIKKNRKDALEADLDE